MNILALDCSGDTLSVCVAQIEQENTTAFSKPKHPYKDEIGHKKLPGNTLVEIAIDAGYRHTERLMMAVDYCVTEAGLKPQELDLLACTAGPGSFTGLRIGLSTVKGLALGLNKPFVCIPTLDAISYYWMGVAPVLVPVIDAKRSHFYFAIYEDEKIVHGPFDKDIQYLFSLLQHYSEVLFVGPDADILASSAQERSGFRLAKEHNRPLAKAVANLAMKAYLKDGPASSSQGLNYLRASDAEEART